LRGWFRRLGNCCFAARVLGVAPVEVAVCWAPSLSGLFEYWLRGMLFVMVAKGKLWLVGWDDFGSWWRRNCMVGSMPKGNYGSVVGTLNASWSVGTWGGTMKMTAMDVASGMCG
jgi:hypothetical protein